MIDGIRAQRMFESFAAGKSTHNGKPVGKGGVTGPRGFVKHLEHILGLRTDDFGRRVVKDTLEDGTARVRAEEFNFCELAEACMTREGVALLRHGREREVLEAGGHATLEAGEIVPGHFPNISAYTASISKLLEVKVLEGYQRPGLIGDQLAPPIPTKLRAEKMPGVSLWGDDAVVLNPGDEHPALQLQERYVETPETTKRGGRVDVTKEAAFFDITNQLLTRAQQAGQTLALNREKRIIDVVTGITNPYQYNGTSYNTYLTSGNWINDHVNIMQDWTDLNAARILASRMTDQEQGERILVELNTVLCTDYLAETASYIANATANEQRTATTQENVRTGPNRESGRWKILTSPILEQRLTDTDGAALSQAAAQDRWFYGEYGSGGAFGYMQNWAMDVQQASAGDYQMLNRGLIMSIFFDEMGVAVVLEPRKTIRNKQA